MKQDITTRILFVFLAYNGEFNSCIFAEKVYIWDQIDATKKNNADTFSLQCQDQMVKVESNVYHLDRLQSSLKSGYFEKLFISNVTQQNKGSVLEIRLKNSEVFPAVIELIRGKELIDVLDKDNYFPLLETMHHLEMEIDLQIVSNFIDENLKSYSLPDSKICDLYKFIREIPNFNYLLESVMKHFSNNLATLQNHTIFPSMPLDHLIWIINKVGHSNEKKRYEIIQICTEWLCHDMESRLFHMANLVVNIESAFRCSIETNTKINNYLPKFDVNKQMKRKIISRVLFVLLASKQLDPNGLDKLKPNDNLKSLSPQDAIIFKLYHTVKNNSKLEYLSQNAFKYFADNLTMVQNHKIFSSLPYDHLIRIIKHVQEPNDEKRYEIIQMCTEWLCYDMENRLPHLVNLVISAKSLFHSSIEMNTDVSNCLPRCHVDEHVKREIISKCLFSLLTNDEQLNSKILTDDESNYHNDDGYYLEEGQRKLERECARFVNCNDECAKLKKFLNNSEFYDIVVQVKGKSYKLHRIFLESKSNYFRGIFETEYAEANAHCDEVSLCPRRDKEYALDDEIDPSGFDKVLDYIYFDTNVIDFSWDNATINIFNIADILGIEKLSKNCKDLLLKKCHARVNSQNIVEILKLTYGKSKYEDLYLSYLYKHIITNWPGIYNVSHFCSISWTMLENMLNTPGFHLYDLDPNRIPDIFSKWVHHDPNTRYHFLPRIAQIVNPYCGTNHSEYASHSATESSNFSQSFIRDQLFQILSSPSYMVRSKKLPRKLEEIPMFIASKREYPQNKIILNADLDIIASYNYSVSYPISSERQIYSSSRSSVSATLINDNLFTFSNHDNPLTFHVYNLLLQKYFPLQTHLLNWRGYYTLLSCNNEIYICSSSNGQIMRYWTQFNQWTTLSQDSASGTYIYYTSDGETLYRMYGLRLQHFFRNYVVERYDFETNLWSRVSGSALPTDISKNPHIE